MVKNIIHNPVFRIFTPIFYGVTMYILILLIFDSIQQLSENFFSIEVFLCVIITYLIFESLRVFALIVEKKCSVNCSVSYRIFIQGGGSVVIALAITTLIISFYFSKLVGFSSYGAELTVFDTIFVLTGILYNMIYFSFFYLNRINVTQLEQEDILRKNTEIELDTYKNKINPDFLYDSLESLISLSKINPEDADQFILKLSDVYRNILSNKKSELTLISSELNISKTLIEIFNYKLNGNLQFSIDSEIENGSHHIISGTMVVIIEDIINRSIISNIEPLEINGEIENNVLKIHHPVQNKLVQNFSKRTELKQLKTAYLYYGKKSISIDDKNNIRTYNIPVFEMER
ncbi:MAG: histidine kinase [Bacteroidales bacterium]|nr:histidine kinase [Bacteroidales bacterium]